MIELLRTIALFTPTQKDDELIAKLDKFIDDNPELAAMLLKFLLGLAKAK